MDVTQKNRTFVAIDLKSFYASAECVERGYNALTTNLVVADRERTDKTICLAVSPSLKEYGITGRPRLFEVERKVNEINRIRLSRARTFSSESFDSTELAANPNLKLSFIVAKPRMKLYEEISTGIFSIYCRYISPDDIHVYSIDECFMDVTEYLHSYKMTALQLTEKIIRDVYKTTGITATAGIGTNLYLAKIAMDIQAKHIKADSNGVRIASLNEQQYREQLWCHTPLTDFWRCGKGTVKRLAALRCFTMGDIARKSIENEEALYKAFGVNAELLIDHAWGWEPTLISTIKAYKPKDRSLSSAQVLAQPYPAEKACLVVKEMADLLALNLVEKNMLAKQISLLVFYDRASIHRNPDNTYIVSTTGKKFTGTVSLDYYGRPAPEKAYGTANIDRWTSSSAEIIKTAGNLFGKITSPDLLVKRICIAASNLIFREDVQPDLFSRIDNKVIMDEKELLIQQATLKIKNRFGKNSIMKAMNLEEGATTIQRNKQIGGHNA